MQRIGAAQPHARQRHTCAYRQIVVVTGASSGFGWMSAHRLADAGHTVHAGMRATAGPTEVARAVVRVVDTPFGQRPLRTHIDPSQDGAEVVNAVADRLRSDFYGRIGLADLLHPRAV